MEANILDAKNFITEQLMLSSNNSNNCTVNISFSAKY